jgi:hypothetical protein
VAQLVARLLWEQEATGSSPVTPTTMNILYYWLILSSFLFGTIVGILFCDYIDRKENNGKNKI